MGVPMRWTGLRRWEYLFVTVAPNYIHVLSTATATGAAWAMERWSVVPVIGSWIGAAGLPGVITFLLVLNFIVHGFLFFFSLGTSRGTSRPKLMLQTFSPRSAFSSSS